jgi:predicted GNAT family N-acyltransferase
MPPGPELPDQTSEEVFLAPLPKWEQDRATSLHDGKELYVKLGRLCVVKSARGSKAADLLIQAALKWAGENPQFCAGEQGGEWKGLVCVHAYEKATTTWGRNGFVEDEGLESWMEARLRHVGMFCRVPVKS